MIVPSFLHRNGRHWCGYDRWRQPSGQHADIAAEIGYSEYRTFAMHSFASLREIRMPHLTTDDGVKLYYEEVGAGAPIVFVHEFAGDCSSWEHQLR